MARPRPERLAILLTALAVGSPAAGQGYNLPAHVVAGGGSTGTGGTYALTGTIGQPIATSDVSLGGTHAVLGGFWHVADRSAVPFTDPVLTPGVSTIRLVHVTELRQRIDALRTRHSLAPYAWTDPTLAAGVTIVRAVHFTELRSALAQAYAAAGRAAPTYAGGIGAGITITAGVIAELRAAVLELE